MGDPTAYVENRVTLDKAAVAALEAGFRGQIVGPEDADYDRHRKIWNGSFDRRSAVIARCAGVADVISAVRLGRMSGLPVAVRSGGHSFPGLSIADDALVIDLGPVKSVRVDPEARTARVQTGVLARPGTRQVVGRLPYPALNGCERWKRLCARSESSWSNSSSSTTFTTPATASVRRTAVVIAGHAFLQNLRRGHYELGVDARPAQRLAAAFAELATAI